MPLSFFFDLMRVLELAHEFAKISLALAAIAPHWDTEDIGQPFCRMESGQARDLDLREALAFRSDLSFAHRSSGTFHSGQYPGRHV